MSTPEPGPNVLVTGATGFVGRRIVRELLARGLTPVCLVRSPDKLLAQHRDEDRWRITAVKGDLGDQRALTEAAGMSQAAIHLVGIIIARRLKGQSFHAVHYRGTQAVVDAVKHAGIKRYLHMSALGTRSNAVSEYHRTKWQAEEYVRAGGLDWTMFRPSLIHGPDGEFMQLVKAFVCGLVPPVIPYFGDGQAKLQPVDVRDVAYCFVDALFRPETIHQIYELGGPKAYTWLELYAASRRLLPCAKRFKPYASLPVPMAKLVALASGPPMALAELVAPSIGMFRFDVGQVQMSQEDSVCDVAPVENAFNMKMRSFETELAAYADRIP